MTPQKVLEVIEIYQRKFDELGLRKINYPHDDILEDPEQAMEHCYGMLTMMIGFVSTGHMEKVQRWLGFIQGCLWQSGVYTLEELDNHHSL